MIIPCDADTYAVLVPAPHDGEMDVLPAPVIAWRLTEGGVVAITPGGEYGPGAPILGCDGTVQEGMRVWPDVVSYVGWIESTRGSAH